mmetsp:Transcript_1975/g.5206  ORF Transcript_1975/g.5206 Transcript_1975/m.5206 type:complete len:736 (-) Transcript_1975:1529-3736(-)
MGDGSDSARADDGTSSGHSESGDVAANSTSSSRSSAAAEASSAVATRPRKKSRQSDTGTLGEATGASGSAMLDTMRGASGPFGAALGAAMVPTSGSAMLRSTGDASSEPFLTIRKSILDAVVLQQHKRIVELEHSIQKTRHRIQRLRSSASAARAANAAAAAATATAAGHSLKPAATSSQPGDVQTPYTPAPTQYQYHTPTSTPHLPSAPVCPPATPTTPAVPEQGAQLTLSSAAHAAHHQQPQLFGRAPQLQPTPPLRGAQHPSNSQQHAQQQQQQQHPPPPPPPQSSPLSIAPNLAPRSDPVRAAALSVLQTAPETQQRMLQPPPLPNTAQGGTETTSQARGAATASAHGHSTGGAAASSSARQKQSRYWTQGEHERFLHACLMFGERNYAAIAAHVGSRTPKQVRTHAQKYAKRLQREESRRREAEAFVSIRLPEAGTAHGAVSTTARASAGARAFQPILRAGDAGAGAHPAPLFAQAMGSTMPQGPAHASAVARETTGFAGGGRMHHDDDDDEDDDEDDDDEDDMQDGDDDDDNDMDPNPTARDPASPVEQSAPASAAARVSQAATLPAATPSHVQNGSETALLENLEASSAPASVAKATLLPQRESTVAVESALSSQFGPGAPASGILPSSTPASGAPASSAPASSAPASDVPIPVATSRSGALSAVKNESAAHSSVVETGSDAQGAPAPPPRDSVKGELEAAASGTESASALSIEQSTQKSPSQDKAPD